MSKSIILAPKMITKTSSKCNLHHPSSLYLIYVSRLKLSNIDKTRIINI